jgi:hypothetical protein
LALRALIAKLVYKILSQDEFQKLSKEKQKIIMEWEYKKILQKKVPKLCKSNEIHYELKKLDAIHAMIKTVIDSTRYSGIKIYGGFVRDYYCSNNTILPNDIDIRFSDQHDMDYFVSELVGKYEVIFCENTPAAQYPPNTLPKIVCGCCDPYKKVPLYVTKYDTKVTTIQIRDSKNNVSLQLDLTIKSPYGMKSPIDFDVNTLELKRGDILSIDLPYHCHDEVRKHITKREFVVLTASGEYKMAHRVYPRAQSKMGVEYTHYDCMYVDCICRHSSKGKKIQERIKKMQTRGWKALNPPCENPLCILSPEDVYQAYIKEMVEKHQFIEQRKRERMEKLEREASLEQQELRRKAKLEARIKEQEESVQKLERQFKSLLTEKEAAILAHGKSKKPHTKVTPLPRKSQAKNYRKGDINKKFVWVEGDDYDLARDMDLIENDESDEELEEKIVINIDKYDWTKNCTKDQPKLVPLVQFLQTLSPPEPILPTVKPQRVDPPMEILPMEIPVEMPYEAFLDDKQLAILRFDKKIPKSQSSGSKRNCNTRDYRKGDINKKRVWVHPDDHDLARDMDYLEEDEEEDIMIPRYSWSNKMISLGDFFKKSSPTFSHHPFEMSPPSYLSYEMFMEEEEFYVMCFDKKLGTWVSW